MAAAEDWVARTAAQVREEGERRHPGEVPTCASGISPSGPVHLGNLRELMTPHLIADEVRRNGAPCRHILSWDDYDRLRRVPLGVPGSFAEYVGRPLTGVPDPCGQHENFAEHFKEPLRESLDLLGIQVTEISQTEMYTSGAYTEQIVLAMRRRGEIGAALARYRTRRSDALPADEGDEDEPQTAVYYPFRPYCATCGRDDTTVTGFDDETTEITYTCGCGAVVGPVPIADVAGKLAWKVDWPMRWAYEHVTFEPAGVDHASPGSSFTVGEELVTDLRRRDAAALRVRLRRRPRVGQAERVPRWRADPGRRAGDLRARPAALAVRAAPSRAVHHPGLQQRGRPDLRRVGRAEPEGRRGQRRTGFLRQLRPRVQHLRRAAAGHPAPAEVLHPGLGGRHHGRRRDADAADRARPDRRRPGGQPGRGPAPAGLRAGLGHRVRPGRRPDPGPRGARRRTGSRP